MDRSSNWWFLVDRSRNWWLFFFSRLKVLHKILRILDAPIQFGVATGNLLIVKTPLPSDKFHIDFVAHVFEPATILSNLQSISPGYCSVQKKQLMAGHASAVALSDHTNCLAVELIRLQGFSAPIVPGDRNQGARQIAWRVCPQQAIGRNMLNHNLRLLNWSG